MNFNQLNVEELDFDQMNFDQIMPKKSLTLFSVLIAVSAWLEGI